MLTSNVRRVAMLPTVQARAAGENNENNRDNILYVPRLSHLPCNLYVLWNEWEFGIERKKPAKELSAKE